MLSEDLLHMPEHCYEEYTVSILYSTTENQLKGSLQP